MQFEKKLLERAHHTCELCGSPDHLSGLLVAPREKEELKNAIAVCASCKSQIKEETEMNANHWRCLNDSIWNENDAVKVVSWRMLHRIKSEGWPQDLLDMMYLDEETLEWARATGEDKTDDGPKHRDVNGVILSPGDSVVLIKDLNVKGTSFIAKRGTAVRRISLVLDNIEHIEGKVNGQQIVILTQYVKKTK